MIGNLFALAFLVMLALKLAFVYHAAWGVNLPWLVVVLPLIPALIFWVIAIVIFFIALIAD